jgi:hypothetical protein
MTSWLKEIGRNYGMVLAPVQALAIQIWHCKHNLQGIKYGDRVLLVISLCKFYRGCTMQFRGSSVTSDRDSGSCIMIKSPSHTSLVVQQFLAKNNIPVITQPLYSLDFRLSDFWLFLTSKMGLTGIHFTTMEGIKSNVTTNL